MEKRLVLAVIFSILILMAWGIMFPQPEKKPLQETPFTSRQKEPVFVAQKEMSVGTQLITPQGVTDDVPGISSPGKDIPVDTPIYKAIFSTKGAVLTSFQLKKYPEERIRKEDIERAVNFSRDEAIKKRLNLLKEKIPVTQGVEMVSPFSPIQGSFPLSLVWQGEASSLNNGLYEIDKRDNNLIFSFRTRDNLRVTKHYTLRQDAYLIEIEIRLENQGSKTFPASPLFIKYGPGMGLSTDPFNKGDPYYRCLALIKEAGREKIVSESFRRGRRDTVLSRSYPNAIWGGLENKYFLAAFLPPDEPHSFLFEKDDAGQLNAGLKMQMPEIIPGGSLSRKVSLYLGPKQKEAVQTVGRGLEKSIDYGMIATVLRIMDILRFFYRMTRNWGMAIIMLTILTKIILLPLTQKSMGSMETMQKLQPRMKEIRLKYKDDPRKQQKELMELYRREGVNPMGGCLPMLLQMPIFIALFTTLRNTIDIRGAGFLWIKDLSMPDTVCYIGGIPLNPLPVVMGLSMFWQQKMTTVDPEQAKMMMFMPILFTFMFYNFSSGLALYWFVQNILTLAHQYGMRVYAKKK